MIKFQNKKLIQKPCKSLACLDVIFGGGEVLS